MTNALRVWCARPAVNQALLARVFKRFGQLGGELVDELAVLGDNDGSEDEGEQDSDQGSGSDDEDDGTDEEEEEEEEPEGKEEE